MDGNGRWALRRDLPRGEGHRQGLEAARKLVRAAVEFGVRRLTLFAFSSENWRRPPDEVRALLKLFAEAAAKERKNLLRNRISIRFIGEREKFPANLRRAMAALEKITARGDRIEIAVAVGYGGRWDIVQAARRALAEGLRPDELDEKKMESLLADGDPPDLLIRTGGERRLSNFLLWQAAYAELYFTDTLWPDFDEKELQAALQDFSKRDRRFGITEPESESESDSESAGPESDSAGPERSGPSARTVRARPEKIPAHPAHPAGPAGPAGRQLEGRP